MNVVALVMTSGLILMLVLPGVAALVMKVRGRRDGRAVERTAEVEDVFDPGHRRQAEQLEVVDSLRVDADSGDGDPLRDFPDPDALRDQLDPEHVHEARRARSSRWSRMTGRWRGPGGVGDPGAGRS